MFWVEPLPKAYYHVQKRLVKPRVDKDYKNPMKFQLKEAKVNHTLLLTVISQH